MSNLLYTLVLTVPALLISITVHEFSHAYAAHKMGDPTPELLGRLTLNPLKHLDPLGTLMLIVFRFGWAKPVPINTRNMKNPRTGLAIVSLAGPVSNMVMALIGGFLFRIFLSFNSQYLNTFFYVFVYMNIALAIFNLLPIPPLDGFHLLATFVKNKNLIEWLARYGTIAFIALLFLGSITNRLDFLGTVINPVVNGIFVLFGLPGIP